MLTQESLPVALVGVLFDHYGGYHFNDTTIRVFSHTHTVGAGVSDYGNIGIMATSHINETMLRDSNYRSHFNHSSEIASPGLYKIGRAVQQECRDRSRMPSSA
eukprot:TRINITY_DN12299_c0_g1_i10.p1 TRINITY_DN12299_c0_g1~~TRINITY_DN12299_c0_g1_i10.p1  ORF type:complete len:103 (+),score=5.72 TRINITY_DN12299_c0_g1_i10:77-385(+)